jgi:hypothetical protein
VIGIIMENNPLLNSPTYDVMEGSGGVDTGLAWHDSYVSQMEKEEKHNFMSVPISSHLLPGPVGSPSRRIWFLNMRRFTGNRLRCVS